MADPHNEEKTKIPGGKPLLSADQGPRKEHMVVTNARTEGKFRNDPILPKGKGDEGRKESERARIGGS